MGFGGTGDEITAMREGWLTASVLRSIDDSGAAVADAIVAHSRGEPVEQVLGRPLRHDRQWTPTPTRWSRTPPATRSR